MDVVAVGLVFVGLGVVLYVAWLRNANRDRGATRLVEVREDTPPKAMVRDDRDGIPPEESVMQPTLTEALSAGPDADIVLLRAHGDGRYVVLGKSFDSADEAGRYLTRELVRAYFPEGLDDASAERSATTPAPVSTETGESVLEVPPADIADATEDPVADVSPPPRPVTFATSDGTPVLLRTATAADAARVAALANALDREVGDATEPHTEASVVDGMLSGAAGLVLWVLVPEDAGRGADGAVGYALVQDMYDTDGAEWTVWLHDLYIEDAWRDRALGAELMAHLACEARSSGRSGLWWGVHRNNWKAERFYRRLGAHRAPIYVMGVAGPTLDALAAKAA